MSMPSYELRQLFLGGGRFPTPPCIAGDVLRLPGHPGSAVWREIASVLSFDPALSRAVIDAADALVPGAPTAHLEQAVLRLGRGGVRKAVFRQLAAHLFPYAGGRRLDRAEFWRHAFLAAECAECLAGRVGSPHADDAYVAALLHDIGKAALDSVIEDGYSSAFEATHAQGLSALDAERRELGVDHALAGKWLAEHWGLPEPFVAAIWLHHQPPGVLDDTQYPVQLIDIVALADAVAHRVAYGVLPADAEERAQRLGVALEELIRLAAPSPETPEAAPGRLPSGPAAPDTHDFQRFEARTARYQALHELNRNTAPGQPLRMVLRSIATAFRTAFGMRAGLCYAVDEAGAFFDGALWRSDTDEPRAIRLALTDPAASSRDPLVIAAANLVDEFGGKEAADVGGERKTRAPSHRHGLWAIPLPYQGQSYGQLVFDAADSPLRFSEEDAAGLAAFGEAAGLALFRAQDRKCLEERSEDLATALWKQELAHRTTLRKERLASVATLAAGAAHEINNPLAAISGRAQMLLNRATEPDQAKALDVIVQQSQRVNRILTDLMHFARPAEPKLEPNLISYLLHKVVSARLDQLEANGIKVVEDYVVGLPRIRVDRRQMEQAFLNVILNAEQAMAGAGGRLTLRVAHKSEGKAVLVQISDTGPGIPSHIVDRIFEPFFTTRETSENTGLGLAVCHGIIENHRGTINVHSAKGQGTTFTITLPAPATGAPADRGPDSIPAPPASAGHRDAHMTILLVEPNPDMRDVLSAALENRGYLLRTAEDGLEALATLLGFPVDLVLLDLAAPPVDGTPPLRLILDRFPKVPLVVTSAFSSVEEAQAALQLGARAYLAKPFAAERLLREVDQILASRNVA